MHYRELLESETPPILMWHGGRMDGSAEVQTPRKGRYEAGPGIYMTTKYDTARKYAKGGGATFLVSVKPDLHLAEDVLIPLQDGIDFAQKYLGGKKKNIIADLRANCDRHNADAFRANVIVNLVVNYEAGSGRAGMALAKFLSDSGVDGSLYSISSKEQWLVICNPAAILNVKRVAAADVSMEMRDLPRITFGCGG